MPYSFDPNEASLEAAIRRIGGEQIDRALADIDRHEAGALRAVHQVRKRSKKLRALFRLIRPAFPDYSRENANVRDTARALSGTRDAAAMIATAEALLARHGDELSAATIQSVREALLDRLAPGPAAGAAAEDRLGAAREAVAKARSRGNGWILTDTGVEGVLGGFSATYDRARNGLSGARAGSHGDVHEWRKWVKYHGLQIRLLRKLLPPGLEHRRAALDGLVRTLGDAHDLAVLADGLECDGGELRGVAGAEDLGRLARRRAVRLEAAALKTGELLFTDTASGLTGRLGDLQGTFRPDRT